MLQTCLWMISGYSQGLAGNSSPSPRTVRHATIPGHVTRLRDLPHGGSHSTIESVILRPVPKQQTANRLTSYKMHSTATHATQRLDIAAITNQAFSKQNRTCGGCAARMHQGVNSHDCKRAQGTRDGEAAVEDPKGINESFKREDHGRPGVVVPDKNPKRGTSSWPNGRGGLGRRLALQS